jgi:predicted metal-dependent phosphoesterase TrpH
MEVGPRPDLHCHSTASDGDLSPYAVIERAAKNGVTTLALTDHDTLNGLAEARAAAGQFGLRLVPGMEVSCLWRKTTLHVVALNFGFDNPQMQQLQQEQTRARQTRAGNIALALCRKGLPDLLEEVVRIAPGGIPGRPHFARIMLERGMVKSMEEAFKRYLGAGKVGDQQSSWPDLVDVMPRLQSAGADTVIAHPCKYRFSWMKLRELIVEFRALGGRGIEVSVCGHSPSEIATLARECLRFDMKASIGSDFHSPHHGWADLGRALALPASVPPIWQDWAEHGPGF